MPDQSSPEFVSYAEAHPGSAIPRPALMSVIDAHASIAAVLQFLMIQHERGARVDMGAVLTVLAALNEILSTKPASISANASMRELLARMGAGV